MGLNFKYLLSSAEKRIGADDFGSNAARVKQIMSIVAKYEITEGLTPDKAVSILQDLGPTFVKIGQIASTHPDILPMEYCDAFGKLRACVTPMPIEVVRQQVLDELGSPVEDLFSEFDEQALGSASIGQVHRAVIRDGGREVAVKIQRPGVAETVAEDLALMKRLVMLEGLIRHGEGQISFKELVDELERTSLDELDFTIEARNLSRFHANNEGRDRITSPNCYPQYCSAGILTEDFARGPRVGSINEIPQLDEADREAIGYLIASNYVQQVLVDGFFHADPHAGNILINLEDKGIEWIDFGMMGTLSHRDREVMSSMVSALAKQDAYTLKRIMLKIATPTKPIDHGALLSQCEDLMDRYVNVDLETFDTAALFSDLTGVLKSQGFDINPSMLMLGRGLVTLEGTIRMVSDKVNIMEVLARYTAESFDIKSAMSSSIRRLAGKSLDGVEAAATLPSKASETLDMMQKGHLKLHIDLGTEEQFGLKLSELVNRLVLALFGITFFLGSCMLCIARIPPLFFDVPVLAIAGFLTSTILMLYVLIRMLKGK